MRFFPLLLFGASLGAQVPLGSAGLPSLGATGSPSPFTFSCPNDGVTGTTTGLVVKLSAANTCINETTADASGNSAAGAAIGICVGNCGTTGNALVATFGLVANCVFDNATTFGHYALLSNVTPGNCRDSGANTINSGISTARYSIGRVLDTGAAGTHGVVLEWGDNPLSWNTLANVNTQLIANNFTGSLLQRTAAGGTGVSYMFGAAASTSPCLGDSGSLLKIQQAGAAGCASDTDFSARLYAQQVGSSIASAATIAPVSPVTHITGTAAITTITAPGIFATSGYGGCITLIPDGLWTLGTSGNIAVAVTAVVSQAVTLCYDNATSKWYPVNGSFSGGVVSGASSFNNTTAPGTTVSVGPNFIVNDSGAANALTVTLQDASSTNVPLTRGLCLNLEPSHTLQAGANTLVLNGGASHSIVSHRNNANNIATAYTSATYHIQVCFDGSFWEDMSQ